MAEIFYAIRRRNGQYIAGAGNSSLPTPRLYLTPQNAETAVRRHWPGVVSNGYTIVRLVVDSKWTYKEKKF